MLYSYAICYYIMFSCRATTPLVNVFSYYIYLDPLQCNIPFHWSTSWEEGFVSSLILLWSYIVLCIQAYSVSKQINTCSVLKLVIFSVKERNHNLLNNNHLGKWLRLWILKSCPQGMRCFCSLFSIQELTLWTSKIEKFNPSYFYAWETL